MKPTLASLIVASACVACSAPVAAQDNTVRAGIYIIQYHVHADDLSGPFTPSGLNLDVKNVNTLYLAYIRRLSSSLDLELAAGWPPKTETVAKGPPTVGSVPYDGQVIATTKWFSPTVLLNYKFLDESSPLRPYVGIGINYTHFYDRTSTDAGNAAAGGPTQLSLSDSWGPAGTIGVFYRLPQNWSLDASFSMAKVKSDLEANTSGVVRKTTIDFKPQTWVLSVGYSF
ncbi:MAG TPA: OmpW family outer membrane protein [Burkholderiaceae bacterium]|nr:OmpW family outer membrane protein [Burkholderiaceae bacterium]